MTYEAAMIVISRPGIFSYDNCHAAAKYIMSAECPPAHIKCDHEANQRKAFVVQCMAHEGIRCQGRWPS